MQNDPSKNTIEFTYEGNSEQRLDTLLAEVLSQRQESKGITRSQLKQRIGAGEVTVNQKRVTKPGLKISPGATIRIQFRSLKQDYVAAYDFELDVVFEDEDLVVINKPAGLVVHPGAGTSHETLLGALVNRYGSEKAGPLSRMGIVHRLDKNTTGLMVVARTATSQAVLARQFEERSVSRRYIALVQTTPRGRREIDTSDTGKIETRLGRHASSRTLMAVLPTGGKRAVTHWKVLERYGYAALLSLQLETGRTHQIRVHMQHIGSAVIGDPDYPGENVLPRGLAIEAQKFGRQALHAALLGFKHPRSNEVISFEAEPPSDFQDLVQKFRMKEEDSQ